VSEAIFGFLGVIVGAVVSLLGEQVTTRRERAARQALRDQERKDRRDAFQRETILALQDAVTDLRRTVAHDQAEKVAKMVNESSAWPARYSDDPPPEDYLEAHRLISKFWPRVFDAELQDLAIDIRDVAAKAIVAGDEVGMWAFVNRLEELADRFSRRVANLLPDLF
jgi:uncharacterized coiled-coil protein SlyX